jgi:hypothetical protein
MNAEDKAYADRLVNNLRRRVYPNAKSAWQVYDLLVELAAKGGCASWLPGQARLLCRRAYGHRPCRRVGLRTAPFHTVQTRKTELRCVGRIKGGHRRAGINPSGQWFSL